MDKIPTHAFLPSQGDKFSQVIGVGLKMKIFHELKDEPRTSQEIAKTLGIPKRGVDRILLLCVKFGVSKETEEEKFIKGENFDIFLKLESIANKWCGDYYKECLTIKEYFTSKKKEASNAEFCKFVSSNAKLFEMVEENCDQFALQCLTSVLLHEIIRFAGGEFDLFVDVSKEPRSKEYIKKKSGIEDEEKLNLLLDYLVAAQLVVEKEGLIHPTKNTEINMARKFFYPGVLKLKELYASFWTLLEYSVRTGKSAAEKYFGMPYFEYLKSEEKYQTLYHQAIKKSEFLPTLQDVAENHPQLKLTEIKMVVDVGGSTGSAILPFVEKNKNVIGKVLDLPDVVKDLKVDEKLASRFEYIGGSFFDSIPLGGDVYLLRIVLHDWSEEKQVEILKNIVKVMKDGARVVVMEDTFKRHFFGALTELHTLTCYGEAFLPSKKEFIAIGKQAGLEMSSETFRVNAQYPLDVLVFSKIK